MTRFRLVYASFPESVRGSVKGITGMNPGDDFYIVIIDKDLSEDQKDRTLKHELSHIALGHFESNRTESCSDYLRNIEAIEEETDNYADQMTDEEYSRLMSFQLGETVYERG